MLFMRVINNMMIDFIQSNMNFLNDIQAYHWQTKSYAEHEALGEYYNKFNELNDRRYARGNKSVILPSIIIINANLHFL